MTQQTNQKLLLTSLGVGISAAVVVAGGALAGHIMKFMMDSLSSAGVSNALVGAAAGAILTLIGVSAIAICAMAVSGANKCKGGNSQ